MRLLLAGAIMLGSLGGGIAVADAEVAEDESVEVLEDSFGGTLDNLASQAQPLAGQRVIEYRGDHIALVGADGGDASAPATEPAPLMLGDHDATPTPVDAATPQLVLSDAPLRAESDAGVRRPLDLTMDQQGETFEASNPLVDFAASTNPADGVDVALEHGEVGITAQASERSGDEGVVVGDVGVLYPDVQADSDLIVAPIPIGAEIFAQLRSPAAPEQLEVDLDLPDGATLMPRDGGGAAIERNGEQIAAVGSPSAVDASGRSVPVSMTVSGSTLTLETSHQGGGFDYPILVDPVLDSYGTWDSGQLMAWEIKGSAPSYSDPTDPNGDYYVRRNCGNNVIGTCFGSGLYVFARKDRAFAENSFAGYAYSPPRYVPWGPDKDNAAPGYPGTSTWVSQARFDNLKLRMNNDTTGTGSPQMKVGIFQDRGTTVAPFGIGAPSGNNPIFKNVDFNGTATAPLNAWNNSTGTSTGTPQGGDPTGKQVWVQLAAQNTRTALDLHQVYLGSAQVYLVDGENPSASASITQTPWFKDSSTRSISITGSDKAPDIGYGGLGIQSLGIATYKPGGATNSPSSVQGNFCNGSRAAPCPVEDTKAFSYPTTDLPSGVNYGVGTASDALAKTQGFNLALWWIKVDRDSPTATVSGGLRGGTGAGSEVMIDATDGSASADDAFDPSDRAAWESGVKRIELFRDGVSVASETYACNDSLNSCPQRTTKTFDVGDASRGTHTWKVEVTDQVSNPKFIEQWTHDGPPETTITAGPQGSTSDKTPTFRFVSDELDSTFMCRLDGQAFTGCSSPWTVGSELGPGSHVFEVKAIDSSSQEDPTPAQRQFEVVEADRAQPEPGKLGLEQYFQYDSTDTGLSGAHANLATGNLVWHRILATNPGRGLTSVVNLTYNSYDYPATGDLPLDSRVLSLDYDEAGLGMSLGISGLTRVNEPLGGVLLPNLIGGDGDLAQDGLQPGAISLTDPDGTTHTFTPDLDRLSTPGSCSIPAGLPTRYESPPGVNLELRRFGCPGTDALELVGELVDAIDVNDPTDPKFVDDFLDLDTSGDNPEVLPGIGGDQPLRLTDLVGLSGAASRSEIFDALYALEQEDLWAITRPDGVTYYFNGFGFATKVVDRDGNTIRYDYEKVNPLGEPCDLGLAPGVEPPIIPGVCEPRLNEVIDPVGVERQDPQSAGNEAPDRTIKLDYYDLSDLEAELNLTSVLDPGELSEDSLGDTVGALKEKLELLGALPGAALHGVNELGKLKVITDHGCHETGFEYGQDGELTRIVEAAETEPGRQSECEERLSARGAIETGDVRRATDFAYQQPGVLSDPLAHRQLASVTEPHPLGQPSPEKTSFTYQEGVLNRPALQAGRPVVGVGDRDLDDGAAVDRQLSYAEGASGTSTASVIDGRGTETKFVLDDRDRPISMTEAAGEPEERATVIGWDDDNNVTGLTRAFGSADEATTTFAYANGNGVLSAETDPLNHTTELGYCDHEGTQQSAFGTDAGGEFVSDQVSLKRPAGNTWHYELDGHAREGDDDDDYCQRLGSSPITGHETAQLDPLGNVFATSYDGHGQISSEIDEEGGETDYRFYDGNGLPRLIVDPEGLDGTEADDEGAQGTEERRHSWIYDYDDLGNVVSVTDPRAIPQTDPPTVPAGEEFTTALTYDSLNRLRTERMPRASGSTPNLAAGPQFTTNSYDYDSTDNLISQTDGEGATTDIGYTPMDQIARQLSPAVEVGDGSGSGSSERLDTRLCYDGEEGRIREIRPQAVHSLAGAGADDPCAAGEMDHARSTVLDPLGRPEATVEEAAGGEQSLITSYAYDLRDNLIGLRDPNRNSSGVESAIAGAAAGSNLRIARTYDAADRPILEAEDPDGLNLKTAYAYDSNDNVTAVVAPRGLAGSNPPPEQILDFTTTLDYDARDLLVSEADPMGNTTTYEFDDAARLISETSPRGNESAMAGDSTTEMTYDANGDLLSRSVPWAEDNFAAGSRQYGLTAAILGSAKTRYTRDPVGDPIKIEDPRGTIIRNSFYDSGELGFTNRPWYWRLDWTADADNPTAGARYEETPQGVNADVAVPIGGPVLQEAGQPPTADSAQQPAGPNSGDFGDVEPEPLPDFLPRAGDTTLAYDKVGRLSQVEAEPIEGNGSARSIDYDGVGRIEAKSWDYGTASTSSIRHEFTYDADSNLTGYIDGEGAQADFSGPLDEQLAAGLDPSDYTTTFTYDAFDRRVSETSPGSLASAQADAIGLEVTRWIYDRNSNVTGRVTPRAYTGSSPRSPAPPATDPDYSFGFGYDAADRLVAETNPVDSTFTYGYDANSNQTTEVNPRGFLTRTSYDRADRPIEIEEGLEGDGDAIAGVSRSTAFVPDADGNVEKIIEPGARPYPGADPASRVTEISYDAGGRPWKTRTGLAEGGDATMPNEERTEILQRDQLGNVVRRIEGEGAYGSSPADPLSDFNSYAPVDPDAEAALDGPTRQATVNAFDEDSLQIASFLPHGGGDPSRYRTRMSYDERGRLNFSDRAYEIAPDAKTTRVDYDYFDTDWIKSASDSRDKLAAGGSFPSDQALRYEYDRRGVQTEWITEAFENDRENGRRIQRWINPSGTLYERRGTIYVAGAGEGDIDASHRTYDYFYNPNRSLIEIGDRVPDFDGTPLGNASNRTTTILRDAAERERKVNEDWRGGRDTVMAYDANDNVTSRRVDGKLSDPGDPGSSYTGGRTSTFEYDALDREIEMEVAGRTMTTSWWDSDEMAGRVKLNGTTEERFYLRSGDLARKVRNPEEGDTTTQTYDYDLNGNRLFDERGAHAYNARDQLIRWDKPSDAQADPGYATSVASPSPNQRNYAEDPAEYPEQGQVEYTVDGNGQILETTEESRFAADLSDGSTTPLNLTTATSYSYDDGYLRQARSSSTFDYPDGAYEPNPNPQITKTYFEHYDDLGNLGQIRVERDLDANEDPTRPAPNDETATAPGCPEAEVGSWTDPETTYHCYDEFGRLAVSQGPDTDDPDGPPDDPQADSNRASQGSEAWIYDGLDRRDVRLIEAGDGDLETRERSYIATSELLSREVDADNPAASGRNELEIQSYDYDSQGMRIGQDVDDLSPSGSDRYSTYDLDAQGSVLGVEDEQGTFDDPDSAGEDSDNHYDYDPYGALQDPEPGNAEADPNAELPDEATDNPFRYQGFYYDSGIQSYDMQARQYRPDIGRFLSQDRFEAAGADLQLQSDPLTQNRYAFAGGNPVSTIEWDGHKPIDAVDGWQYGPGGDRGTHGSNDTIQDGYLNDQPLSSYQTGSPNQTNQTATASAISEVAIAPEIASSVGEPPEAKSILDGIAEAAPTDFAQDALAELGAMASNTVDQATDLDGPCGYFQSNFIECGAQTLDQITSLPKICDGVSGGACTARLGVVVGSAIVAHRFASPGVGATGAGIEQSGWVLPRAAMGNVLGRDALTATQARNLTRFERSVPSVGGPTTIRELPSGGRAFQADVPASDIPGSFATYEKQVDALGETLSFTKTTYAPDGSIVHVKDKISGLTVTPPG